MLFNVALRHSVDCGWLASSIGFRLGGAGAVAKEPKEIKEILHSTIQVLWTLRAEAKGHKPVRALRTPALALGSSAVGLPRTAKAMQGPRVNFLKVPRKGSINKGYCGHYKVSIIWGF